MTARERRDLIYKLGNGGLGPHIRGERVSWSDLSDEQLEALDALGDEPWDGGGHRYGSTPAPADARAKAEHAAWLQDVQRVIRGE